MLNIQADSGNLEAGGGSAIPLTVSSCSALLLVKVVEYKKM